MLPSILDFEASGFGHNSYPIEVGVVLGSGERFCTLITPLEEWTHWDTEAEKVHHIRRDHVVKYGLPIGDVCARLNQLLKNQTVYSDGWVVDKPWLNTLFLAAGSSPTFNLSPIESIQSEAQQMAWSQVQKEILERFSFDRHRASHDALLIQQIYQATRHLK